MNREIASRIVVAADFDPNEGGRRIVRTKVIALAEELQDTGVIIKLNSILRACGYDLIDELHQLGVKVCADLKIVDIKETMSKDGALLREARPEFLTVMANAGVEGLDAINKVLPETDLWGVTVLTSLDEGQCQSIFGGPVDSTVLKFANISLAAGLAGLILSPREAEVIRQDDALRSLELNSPGIRYPWSEVGDQKRFLTAGEAVAKGINRVVIGRPILNAKPNQENRPQSRREALEWIVADIEKNGRALVA